MTTSASLQMNPTIVIKNFPSRTELIYVINEFLSKNQLPKEFETLNQHNCLKLKFQSKPAAYELLSHLTQLSITNELYDRLECYLVIETNKQTPKSISARTSMLRSHNNTNQRMNTMGSNESLLTSASSPSGILNESKAITITHKRNRTSHGVILQGAGDYIHNHYSDIRLKAGIMSTASPYLSEEEKLRISEKKSKEKNISSENFKLFIGRASINKMPVIPNFVTATPSESPKNFIFRKEDNKKWICKRKFLV